MSNDILQMFEGLTADQILEFRRRIAPALKNIRAEIVSTQPTNRSTSMKLPEEKHLEKIKQDNQKRIDGLTARIEARKDKGLSYADLEKELSQVLTTAARGEELAERRLAEAQVKQQATADRQSADRARIAADMDQKRKTAAARVWVGQGGDLKEFETAWPAIREELMKSAVIQEAADRENRTTVVGRSL